jgi:hypothetical protein
MQEVIHESQYAPFDGSNIDPLHLALSTTSDTNPVRQPALYADQAFFFGRCVKSMYFSLLCFYETTDGFLIDFGSVTAHNLIKRRQVEENNICPVRFDAVQAGGATVQFTTDMSKGTPGITTVAGRKLYAFLPQTQFRVAGSGSATAYLAQAVNTGADGRIVLQGFPSFKSGALPSIGYHGVASSPQYSISNVSDLGSSLRLTERIDSIYFSVDGAYAGDSVSITCPAVSSTYDSTAHRTGFADLSQILIAGVSAPITKGTVASDTKFVLTSSRTGTDAVKDIATFLMPSGATTGLVQFYFTDVADITKKDYFTSVRPLIAL